MREMKTFYYEEGNAARKLVEAVPDYQIERQREIQKEQEQKRRARARRKAQAMRQHRLYTVYLVSALVVVCGLLVGYVNLQNSITTRMDNISSLESQISQLKADNSAATSRINTATNLNDVKYQAVNNLGMVYAGADQIVYYDMENTDYMSQYNDIP